MTTQLLFVTHSTSEDNERGIASGWHHSQLSERGRQQARELGIRRGNDAIQAIFTSDLKRAVETAQIAFSDTNPPTAIPIFYDWRLRECDYGDYNGRYNGVPASEIHAQRDRYLDHPYPNGESWRQAVERVGRFLQDLPLRWRGARLLVIGHRATHFGLDHYLKGVPLEQLLAAKFTWQDGWEYCMEEERNHEPTSRECLSLGGCTNRHADS